MKFENRGKWLKEAEDKLAAYDTQEHPDFLDGDDKVCTFEDDEVANFEEDDLDIVEEDDTLDSPEDEEMDLAMEAAMPPMGQRKRIEFEDDIVKVYDGNKEIYAGAEDYEPMQDENWQWDNANKYYKFGKYIKVCCESSQKNEESVNYTEVHVTRTIEESEYFHIEERNNKYYIIDHPSISSKNAFSSIDAAKKQLKDYYSRQFGNKNVKVESSQKNEGKVTAQKFKNWPKRSQVKTAIDRVDEKLFNKLMNEFCLNVAKGDYFPQTIVKNGKLLFALTDEPITLDSIENYFTEDEYLFESSQKNEDNASELKKELNDLYRGIGWAEWDYFKEGLAYSTNFKPNEMSDIDLEKMINASDIAKVKKVREIKNHSSMEDFDPKDFRPDDKIVVTKKPMSSQFHGESSQKNEGSNWEYSVSVLDNYGDIQYSTDCKSQSDIDNAIKKYKARSVELRNADNCTTIEVTKDLVDDDDGNILKSQSIKKISL